ncbi:transcription antitermination factor NusG [Roseivirga pacifica]|uniref:Transcription antitermination factor NusG n=1 Tax=Roseivirga pacifica TaxID=1267423 RepID=A0A1I0N5L1_9BACT|nr:UpxY family transcription antiterminator [Roseivirga pacifica]RKQ50943.1 transcription antitermination factor NusG [Roseivirga pacifica]SEV96370.1 Transcription antitermination factor NusG [Roseivirga pacifica]
MSKAQSKYWTAFYTKPRNEKKVSERLSDLGYEIFCPVRTVLKQWSDRKKKVKEPLFTSYIFARVDEVLRQEILKDQGIVSSVFWLGKPVVVRDSEIRAIDDFLSENPEADAVSRIFHEGEKLQITDGPLRGETGELLKIKGTKLILTIESLGFSLVAEVAKSRVQLVS